jgi:hypothetical protein
LLILPRGIQIEQPIAHISMMNPSFFSADRAFETASLEWPLRSRCTLGVAVITKIETVRYRLTRGGALIAVHSRE